VPEARTVSRPVIVGTTRPHDRIFPGYATVASMRNTVTAEFTPFPGLPDATYRSAGFFQGQRSLIR
jgi:hypothetical protein